MLKIVTILVCAALLGGLTLFLKRTSLGLHMRAAAEDFTMSRLVGVRANTVIVLAFVLSGALAAIVALLFTAQMGFVQPRLGLPLVLLAFVAAVIGGLGSLPGAVLGGFLVGVTLTLLQSLLPADLRPFREARGAGRGHRLGADRRIAPGRGWAGGARWARRCGAPGTDARHLDLASAGANRRARDHRPHPPPALTRDQ
nr:branched-chain amino acid ABC transporter permease [Paracoccus sp. S-4012]